MFNKNSTFSEVTEKTFRHVSSTTSKHLTKNNDNYSTKLSTGTSAIWFKQKGVRRNTMKICYQSFSYDKQTASVVR